MLTEIQVVPGLPTGVWGEGGPVQREGGTVEGTYEDLENTRGPRMPTAWDYQSHQAWRGNVAVELAPETERWTGCMALS